MRYGTSAGLCFDSLSTEQNKTKQAAKAPCEILCRQRKSQAGKIQSIQIALDSQSLCGVKRYIRRTGKSEDHHISKEHKYPFPSSLGACLASMQQKNKNCRTSLLLGQFQDPVLSVLPYFCPQTALLDAILIPAMLNHHQPSLRGQLVAVGVLTYDFHAYKIPFWWR